MTQLTLDGPDEDTLIARMTARNLELIVENDALNKELYTLNTKMTKLYKEIEDAKARRLRKASIKYRN